MSGLEQLRSETGRLRDLLQRRLEAARLSRIAIAKYLYPDAFKVKVNASESDSVKSSIDEVKFIFLELARALARRPEFVDVVIQNVSLVLQLTVLVHPDDHGALVGDKGRTLAALQSLFEEHGRKLGLETSLDVLAEKKFP